MNNLKIAGYIIQFRRVGDPILRNLPNNKFELIGTKKRKTPSEWMTYRSKFYCWESVAKSVIENQKETSEVPIYEYRIKPI